MKQYFLSSVLLVLGIMSANAFGRTGHAAIAYIAECNLTPAAKANIEKYLGGHSIVEYASWLDEIRKTPEYKHTDGWHSADVDSLGRWVEGVKKHRAVYGLENEMAKLNNREEMTDSAIAVSIKVITHVVGDMHCPCHTFLPGKSQNRYFTIDGHKYKFHHFWDEDIFVIGHNWDYKDYAAHLDILTEEQKAELASGTFREWVEENGRYLSHLYDVLRPDTVFSPGDSKDFVDHATAVVDHQILISSYRLARVLNSLFDPAYNR